MIFTFDTKPAAAAVVELLTSSDPGDADIGDYAESHGGFGCSYCGGCGSVTNHCGRCSSDSCYPPSPCPCCGGCGYVKWSDASPVGAVARLIEAELLPAHWADDGRSPRWWCHAHMGPRVPLLELVKKPRHWCREVRGGAGRCIGAVAPEDVASVASVASVGLRSLEVAEAVCAETWRALRLVFRAMDDGTMGEHIQTACARRDGPVSAFAAAAMWGWGSWSAGLPGDVARSERSRQRMAAEAIYEAGFALVDLRASAVVLATSRFR